MKRLIIIFVPFLLLQSCSSEEGIFDPTYFMDGFKGITFTGPESPESFGGDVTDWCSDCNPIPLPDAKNDSTEISIVSRVCFSLEPCYPNPTSVDGYTNVRYSIAEEMNIKIYMIDKHYNVLIVLVDRVHSPGSYEVTCDLTGLAPDVYRFIAETDIHFCKGDLLIR
jgi:hypothetical protein